MNWKLFDDVRQINKNKNWVNYSRTKTDSTLKKSTILCLHMSRLLKSLNDGMARSTSVPVESNDRHATIIKLNFTLCRSQMRVKQSWNALSFFWTEFWSSPYDFFLMFGWIFSHHFWWFDKEFLKVDINGYRKTQCQVFQESLGYGQKLIRYY